MKVGYKLYEEQSVYYGRPFTSAAYSFKKGTRVNISLTDTNSSNTYAYYRLKVITKILKILKKKITIQETPQRRFYVIRRIVA